jgi:cysteinyl-tRNA synthetase
LQDAAASTPSASSTPAAVAQATAEFDAALDDDLNISAALGVLFNFIRDTNKRLASNGVPSAEAAAMLLAWQRFDTVLGLGMPQRGVAPAEVVALAEQRQAARKAKDFKRADTLREELKNRGWVIEDTPAGPKLKRL